MIQAPRQGLRRAALTAVLLLLVAAVGWGQCDITYNPVTGFFDCSGGPAGPTGPTGPTGSGSGTSDCAVTYGSGSVLNIGACGSQVGGYTPTAIAACATSAAPSGSGTLNIYLPQDTAGGAYILAFSGANTTTCTGWTAATNVANMPTSGVRPIASVTWTSGAWNNDVVDLRRVFAPSPIAGGADLPSTVVNGVVTYDVGPNVPRKADVVGNTATYATTAGGTTAYTLTTPFTGFTANANGVCVLAKMNATNTGTSTLSVNSETARQIWKHNGASAAGAVASGDLIANQIYEFCYNTSLNTSGAWVTSVGGGGSSGATIHSNTYANLATTNCTTGDAFFFQDSLFSAARCTATNTWGQVFVGGKLVTVPPSNGSYTSETTGASGTYSLDNTGGTLNIKVGSDEATGVSANYLAALVNSTTFTITIGVDLALFGGTYPNFRLGVSTGTASTSDEVTIAVGALGASGTTPAVGVQKMDNWVFNTWYWTNNIQVGAVNRLYLRIRQASGSRHFEYSRDGNTWQIHTTTTSTDHISSPTHYYFAASGNGVASIFHVTNE